MGIKSLGVIDTNYTGQEARGLLKSTLTTVTAVPIILLKDIRNIEASMNHCTGSTAPRPHWSKLVPPLPLDMC